MSRRVLRESGASACTWLRQLFRPFTVGSSTYGVLAREHGHPDRSTGVMNTGVVLGQK